MPTITFQLDSETHARVRHHLQRSGAPLSEFIRAAVTDGFATSPKSETAYEAWVRLSKNCVGSDETDLSVTYKARTKEKLRAKHRR